MIGKLKTLLESFDQKCFFLLLLEEDVPQEPLGMLDTQHDPLRGKLPLHGKRQIRSNMTT